MTNASSNEHLRVIERTATNTIVNIQYKKSFVENELPDLAAVEAAGIELPLAEARLVLMLASRVIAHGHSKARSSLYVATSFIDMIVATRVPRPGGDPLEPLLAGAGATRIPDGKTALKRLGLDTSDISAAWAELSTFATSCLPLAWVLSFLPARAWPTVVAFVGCSADELSPRIDEALRRHGAHAGPARLWNDLTALRLVMRTLVDLRRELRAENKSCSKRGAVVVDLPEALDSWTALPALPAPRELEAWSKGGRGRRDTGAVPVEQIHDSLVSRARAVGIGKWQPLEWPPDRNWRALKELALLCLLVTAGLRVDHLRLLDIDDFDPAHTFENGSCGPGVRCRRILMKNGGHRDDVYWKRLPSFVGDVLTAWIVCSGRTVGQPGAPLLIPTRIMESGDPGTRYSEGSSLSKAVAGTKDRRRPLIPIPGEEWRGYSPHRFRHTITQVVERRFAVWKLENPSHPLGAYDAKVVAELALDHKINDLGYRDYADRRRLEEVLALAIDLCWDECWAEGFQRIGLDPEAIVEARDDVLLLEAELKMTIRQVDELEKKQAKLWRRARSLQSDQDKLRAYVDAQALGAELQTKLRRESGLKDKLTGARVRLEAARTNRVALPDDLDGAEYELRLAEALEPGQLAEPDAAHTDPLSDELLVGDVADLYGVSEMTVRRWRAGQSNPPIQPAAWIKVNAKDWRYPVSAIDDQALARVPADDPRAVLDRVRVERARLGFRNRKRQGDVIAAGA